MGAAPAAPDRLRGRLRFAGLLIVLFAAAFAAARCDLPGRIAARSARPWKRVMADAPLLRRRLVDIPAGADGRRLWVGRSEVTRAEFGEFLTEVVPPGFDVARHYRRQGSRCIADDPFMPVAHVSPGDAERYCAWLSEKTGLRVRLPTEVEWVECARAGLAGAPYPWGWAPPEGRAQFAAAGPERVGRRPPNPYGLHDLAGNVAEWCAAAAPDAVRRAARGGSWAERDPALLQIDRPVALPADYRDADVGFRIVVEPPAAPRPSTDLRCGNDSPA